MLYGIVVTVMQLIEERKYIVKDNHFSKVRITPQNLRTDNTLSEPKKLVRNLQSSSRNQNLDKSPKNPPKTNDDNNPSESSKKSINIES